MDFGIPRLGGEVHPAYANPRDEVTAVVPTSAERILDVGCSVGVMGESLRKRGHIVVGIELEPELAEQARQRLDRVIEGDVEAMASDGLDPGGPFDCICFADVLEHLKDPWTVVRWAEGLLAPDGVVIMSIPNVARLETLWYVVRRVWPYQKVGVFDRTHLRFFARRNLPQLLRETSLQITEVRRVYRLWHNPTLRWNWIGRLLGDFGTLQFLVRAERAGAR